MSGRLIAALLLTSLGLALPAAPASAAFVSLAPALSTPTQANFDVLITSTARDPPVGQCATPPCLVGVDLTLQVNGPWTALVANENGTPFPLSNFNADNIGSGEIRYGGTDLGGLNFGPVPFTYKLGELQVTHNLQAGEQIEIVIFGDASTLFRMLCGFAFFCDNPLGQGIGTVLATVTCDTDADTICDVDDPCPAFANTLLVNNGTDCQTTAQDGDPIDPNADCNGDRIPNECQCGDINLNGRIDLQDALFAFNCLPPPNLPASICDPPALAGIGDANNTGAYELNDALFIFNSQPGKVFPPDFMTCPNRPPPGGGSGNPGPPLPPE